MMISSSTTTNNDSDSLFASFSSVSMKYVSELSGTHKHRLSSKQENDSASSTDISRANSCTDSLSSNNIIQIDSTNDFQPLLMSQSMIEEKSNEVESISKLPSFGSGTFEPILLSSDESESSSKKLILSSSPNDENKSASSSSSTKHYKQRKTPLKLLEQQNSIDSGDDIQQEINKVRYHRKSRIPRALSPIQLKPSNLTAPIVSISSENVQTDSVTPKPVKYNNQRRNFPHSLSKSFSSSSSSSSPPPTTWFNNQVRKP